MAEFQQGISCCGLRELNSISNHSTPAEALKKACSELIPYNLYTPKPSNKKLDIDHLEFSQVVFSQAYVPGRTSKTGYGDRLMAFIEEHNLGTVVRGRTNTNPNSGNRLTVFLWAVNRAALVRWYNATLKADK